MEHRRTVATPHRTVSPGAPSRRRSFRCDRYPAGVHTVCSDAVLRLPTNWLQVLGTTETPHIDQGVRQQFHPVVALLDVLETEQQPFEFVLPRKRPLDALP
jgi:hypothetical protein